jgi:hypothetical protein
VKHTGDPDLRGARVARDRPEACRAGISGSTGRRGPSERWAQDRRVIDALTAAAMVVEHSTGRRRSGRCTKSVTPRPRRKDMLMWPFKRKKALTGTRGPRRDPRPSVGPVPAVGRREPAADPGRVQHGAVRELRVDLHRTAPRSGRWSTRSSATSASSTSGCTRRSTSPSGSRSRTIRPRCRSGIRRDGPGGQVHPVDVQGLPAVRQRVRADGPGGGSRSRLNRMPAHMVEIRGASMFDAEGYRFWRRDGSFVDFAPEQVLALARREPDDPRMGVSRLDTLRA